MTDFYDRASVGLLIEAVTRHDRAEARDMAEAIRALHDHFDKPSNWTYSVACQKFDKLDEDTRAQILKDATQLAGAFASVTNVRTTLEGFLNNLAQRRKAAQGPSLLGAINR